MNAVADKLSNWLVPTAASLLLTALGGAILWGQYSQRVSSLELSERDLMQRESDDRSKLATHDTQIALINQKLDTIIQQLAQANAKLDQVKK